MSAIGLFGEFLVNNQLAVDAFLLCLLVALIAIYLFRMLVIKPKKDAEISELIKKIEALESKLDSAGKVGTVEAAPAVESAPVAAPADAAVETVPAAETVVARENTISQDEAEIVATAEAELAKTAEAAEVEAAAEATAGAETAESVEAETEIDAASEGTATTEEQAQAEVEEPSFLDGKLEETLDLREFLVKNRADRDSFNIPGERFMSRTWGEDRHGNIYTEDMLKESIG